MSDKPTAQNQTTIAQARTSSKQDPAFIEGAKILYENGDVTQIVVNSLNRKQIEFFGMTAEAMIAGDIAPKEHAKTAMNLSADADVQKLQDMTREGGSVKAAAKALNELIDVKLKDLPKEARDKIAQAVSLADIIVTTVDNAPKAPLPQNTQPAPKTQGPAQ